MFSVLAMQIKKGAYIYFFFISLMAWTCIKSLQTPQRLCEHLHFLRLWTKNTYLW